MANIVIIDILDNLRNEINKLLAEKNQIFDLLVKYRNFSSDLQNNCFCGQNSSNDFVVKSLEEEYQKISNERQIVVFKSESIDENSEKNSNLFGSELLLKSLEDKQSSGGMDSNETTEDMVIERVLQNREPLNRGFKCKECHKTFLTSLQLRRHKAVYCSLSTVHERTELRERSVVFGCQKCDKTFSVKNSLYQHIRRRHPSLPKPYKYMSFNSTGHRPCPQRGTDLLAQNDLQSNIYESQTHTSFKCNECGKAFTIRDSLYHHMIRSHPSLPKPYKIIKYDFRTDTNTGMTRIRTDISDQNDLDFNECQSSALALPVPIQQLTISPSFKCDECDKTFTIRDSLYQHRRRTHNSMGHPSGLISAKPCLQRGTENLEQNELEYNENESSAVTQPLPTADRISTSFICKECDKTFTIKNSLYQHMIRSHPSVPKPYNFSDLRTDTSTGQAFHNSAEPFAQRMTDIGALNGLDFNECESSSVTQPVPNEDRMSPSFKCEECDKTFTIKNSLYQHMRRTHPSGSKPGKEFWQMFALPDQ